MHLFRPLIYCAFILKYGGQSYTPYFISFFIDFLRFIIEFQIKICRKSQKEELKIRAKEAIVYNFIHNLDFLYFKKSILYFNCEVNNPKQHIREDFKLIRMDL